MCDQKISETACASARNEHRNCQPEAEELEHVCAGCVHIMPRVVLSYLIQVNLCNLLSGLSLLGRIATHTGVTMMSPRNNTKVQCLIPLSGQWGLPLLNNEQNSCRVVIITLRNNIKQFIVFVGLFCNNYQQMLIKAFRQNNFYQLL